MTFKVGRRFGLGLSVTLCLAFTSLLDACRVEPRAVERAAPGGVADGGRFFARTAAGEAKVLSLRSLAVRVTSKPGTMRSHLTMEIAGPPEGDKLEAVMRLAIPPGAAVTGATLWGDGHPMGGAFVERERAREIYRSVVARRRDPALVTWDGPGWIAVSIFPLDGGVSRRFELEWVEPAAVAGGFIQYRAPTVAEGTRILGRASVTIDGRPVDGGDLIALAPASADSSEIVDGRAPGDPFHRLLINAPAAAGPPQVILIAETSAAMTVGERTLQHALLEQVLDGLPTGSKVTLLGADWDPSVIAEGVDCATARLALAKLDDIPSAGALHLERALADAAVRSRKTGADAVLFVGHGADSFWGDALARPLAKLRAAGARLFLVGMDQASAALSDVAALTGGDSWSARGLDVAQRRRLLQALAARPPRPLLTARGLDDWRPLQTVTGQTVWVGRALEAPKIAGGGAAPILAADMSDLLPLWDRARLFAVGRDGRANPEATMLLALTPLRALLVLERPDDYARAGLEAPPPAEWNSHDGAGEPPLGGLALLRKEGLYGLTGTGTHRDPALARALSQQQAKAATSFGALAYAYGTDGFVGNGSGGGGTAEGTIGLGNLAQIGRGEHKNADPVRPRRPPDVFLGPAEIDRPRDVRVLITRVIRRHLNELSFCYERALSSFPDLGGNLTLKLTVGRSGQPEQVEVSRSTLGNGSLDGCIVQAVRRWSFPAPSDGNAVSLSYPLVLTPGGPVPTGGEPVDADLPATEALGILGAPGDLDDRVENVASRLGLDGVSDPESLAWTLDRRGASRNRIILIARLLVVAQRPAEAVRVLSEHAPLDSEAIGAEMRRLGADADAAELTSLAERGR